MPDLLARVLAIGVVAALVPIPILVVLVILAGPSGLSRAWSFVIGFAGSLLVAGTAALLVASESGTSFDPNPLSAIGLVIGAAFLLMAARLAVSRRNGGGLPGASGLTLTGFSGGRAAALGVVAGALNPKTLPIFLIGFAAIAVGGESIGSRSLALVLLTAVASVGVAMPPLLLMVAPGERTGRALARVRQAGERHATAVALVLLVARRPGLRGVRRGGIALMRSSGDMGSEISVRFRPGHRHVLHRVGWQTGRGRGQPRPPFASVAGQANPPARLWFRR